MSQGCASEPALLGGCGRDTDTGRCWFGVSAPREPPAWARGKPDTSSGEGIRWRTKFRRCCSGRAVNDRCEGSTCGPCRLPRGSAHGKGVYKPRCRGEQSRPPPALDKSPAERSWERRGLCRRCRGWSRGSAGQGRAGPAAGSGSPVTASTDSPCLCPFGNSPVSLPAGCAPGQLGAPPWSKTEVQLKPSYPERIIPCLPCASRHLPLAGQADCSWPGFGGCESTRIPAEARSGSVL